MAIMRIQKTKDYTVMANYHLKDERLSLKAKGLLSMMLMLPDNWDYSVNGLVKIVKEGKTAVLSTLKELKEMGYLRITKNKNETGCFVYVYDVFEKPINAENPCHANPDIENLCMENVTQINTKEINTKEQSTKNKINVTKVTLAQEPKSSYGNEDINRAFDEWEKIFGFKMKSSLKNRRAVYNLLRNKEIGFDKLINLIKALAMSQTDKYAPKEVKAIVDFASLQANYSYLMMWGRRKYQQSQSIKKGFEL